MKILTLGNGFIASHLPYNKILDRLQPTEQSINDMLVIHKPDVIINCIGFCGNPTVDQCEILKEKTSITNTVIPIILANQCRRLNIRMINIASGCIFYGLSPHMYNSGWKEEDIANPVSYYSKCKYSCDLAISSLPNVTTLRIRMPVSSQINPRNFITKIKNYQQLIDIPNSMTFMDDFVKVVDFVIKNDKTGIYHCTNPDTLTAVEVMQEYQKYDQNHQFSIISEDELDNMTVAKRSNCILNSGKLEKSGFQMTPAKEALQICMKAYCS